MYIQHLSLQASKQAKAADPFLCPIHGPSHRLPDCRRRRRRLKYGTPVGPTGPDRGCVIYHNNSFDDMNRHCTDYVDWYLISGKKCHSRKC